MIDWILNKLGVEKCPKRDRTNRSSGLSYCVRPKGHFGPCRSYKGTTFNGK